MKYLIFILYLLLQYIFGFTFYFNTTSHNLNIIKNITNYNNSYLFIFFPGTSSKCEYYSDLFKIVDYSKLNEKKSLSLDVLCIDYKTNMNYSINYYKNKSFLDRSTNLINPLIYSLKKINFIKKKNFLNITENKPLWNKLIISGHSQGGVIATAFAKVYPLKKLVLFSSPGCQFGKRLHNWIKEPFITKREKIYGIMSLQDTVLPWNYGNTDFNCTEKDGIYNYLKTINISDNKMQIINIKKNYIIYTNIIKDKQILLLNTPFLNGTLSHLVTCFNTKILNYLMQKLWIYVVFNNI